MGELVALKWEYLCGDNHLHIVREEIRNQDTNAIEVVEHTKTNTDRFGSYSTGKRDFGKSRSC